MAIKSMTTQLRYRAYCKTKNCGWVARKWKDTAEEAREDGAKHEDNRHTYKIEVEQTSKWTLD